MRMTLNISVIVCALAMLCGCGVKPATTAGSSQPAPAVRVPRFEADSAMAHVLAQCAFGPRVPGTPAHEQCGRWIRQQLERWADTVVVQQGQVSTFDGVPLTATNLVGVVNPGAKQRLLLLAHWDCRPWADADPDVSKRRQPVLGANDAASGVAVLLEVAKCLHESRPEVGIDLLMVDVEDWGDSGADNEESWALGTQYWLAHPHEPGYKPVFGILLDMVGARGAQFAPEFFSQQYAGGFVEHVWDAAGAAGCASWFVTGQGGAVTDDHVFVNRTGIPCIDIIDLRAGTEHGFFEGWHTTHDTPDVIDPAVLGAVGQTLLQVIYNF